MVSVCIGDARHVFLQTPHTLSSLSFIFVQFQAAKRRLPLPGQPLPEDRAEAAEASSGALHPEDWVVQVILVQGMSADVIFIAHSSNPF